MNGWISFLLWTLVSAFVTKKSQVVMADAWNRKHNIIEYPEKHDQDEELDSDDDGLEEELNRLTLPLEHQDGFERFSKIIHNVKDYITAEDIYRQQQIAK